MRHAPPLHRAPNQRRCSAGEDGVRGGGASDAPWPPHRRRRRVRSRRTPQPPHTRQGRCPGARRRQRLECATSVAPAAGDAAAPVDDPDNDFDWGLALALAGCAFEAYNELTDADGLKHVSATGTLITFVDGWVRAGGPAVASRGGEGHVAGRACPAGVFPALPTRPPTRPPTNPPCCAAIFWMKSMRGY